MINNIIDCKKNTVLSLKKFRLENSNIIDIFEKIDERLFISPFEEDYLYSNTDIIFNNKIKIPNPYLIIKILDYASIKEDSLVLVIDASTGYIPIFVSYLASTVITTDEDHNNIRNAEKIINKLEINNIILEKPETISNFSNFDNIIMVNSVSKTPNNLIKLLSEEGNITYIKDSNNIKQIIQLKKDNKEVIKEEFLKI